MKRKENGGKEGRDKTQVEVLVFDVKQKEVVVGRWREGGAEQKVLELGEGCVGVLLQVHESL